MTDTTSTRKSLAAAGYPDPAAPADVPQVPRLTAGLELHGEYQGSGFTRPQYIARRGDGQVLQMSQLLHLVAAEIDGRRDLAEIAARVSSSYGRGVSPDNIGYLVQHKLQPLGVVADADGAPPRPAPRSDLLLSLKARGVLFPPRLIGAIARALSWLHRPVVVVAVLVAWVAFDVWFFGSFGAVKALLAVVAQPILLLAVLGLTLASLVFHEFGHASACHYSGARPGCIGFGLYLVWPALYTDVTDVYRIPRAGRLRTDLGGVYFNVIFILAAATCYGVTGNPVFLAAIWFVHFEIIQQLLPVVRLDGYFILGDLAGVPDLFGNVRPILRSMIPQPGRHRARPAERRSDPRVSELKRGTRIVVTAWVLAVCPLLAANLGYAVWNLPRILHAAARSATAQVHVIGAAWTAGRYDSVAVGAVSLLLLALPTVGLIYLLLRIVTRLARKMLARTAGDSLARLALYVGALDIVSAIAIAWLVTAAWHQR